MVIYEFIDEFKVVMVGFFDLMICEVEQGWVEVCEIFKVLCIGMVVGCYVVEGVINCNDSVRFFCDNVVVYEGKIGLFCCFKDDVFEVCLGFDCGIGIDCFQDIKFGDLIEVFIYEEVVVMF